MPLYISCNCSLLRFLLASFILIFLFHAELVQAEIDQRITRAQTALDRGDITGSILTAREALKEPDLSGASRLKFLQLLAAAEYSRSSTTDFKEIHRTINALKTLMSEFPEKIQAAENRWKIVWLYWKHGDIAHTKSAINSLLQHHPRTREAGRALLIRSRILISNRQFDKARQALLQFGLNGYSDSAMEVRGFAWLAVIDRAEEHYKAASREINRAFSRSPEVVTENSWLYSTYIHLLARDGRPMKALDQIKRYLARFVDTPETASVQLLRGDLLARQQQFEQATEVYDMLSEQEAETSIGKRAFIRKLMMQYHKVNDSEKLQAPLQALQKIADRNQLTSIEAEAHLYQAELIARTVIAKPNQAERALDHFVMAMTSGSSELAKKAETLGRGIFSTRMQVLAQNKKWLQTVVLWKRFPQFRPHKKKIDKIALSVARAYRMLTDFTQAEEILNRLEKAAEENIWGEKIMLERAHLWLERGDVDGVNMIMSWLSKHESTLYRPEMLLIVTQMQMEKNQSAAASQTIKGVNADDIAMEFRRDYWSTQARISEKLGRWNAAATAWGELALVRAGNDSRWQALWHQANALFESESYTRAMEIYLQIPDSNRPEGWDYNLGICEIKTGKQKQGTRRLTKLAGKPESGIYALMAKLALQEQKARHLLRSR